MKRARHDVLPYALYRPCISNFKEESWQPSRIVTISRAEIVRVVNDVREDEEQSKSHPFDSRNNSRNPFTPFL